MSPVEFNKLPIILLYGWLTIVLILCATTDLRQRRIPNLLTYPTILFAVPVYSYIDGWDGFLFSVGGLTFGFAVFLIPYLLGGMGAGDVKLMSGVGAVLGFQQTAVCFLFVVICGGIMALGFMVYRRILKETLSKAFLGVLYMGLNRDVSLLKADKNKIAQEGIPYGVAITGGVFLFFLYLILNGQTLPGF